MRFWPRKPRFPIVVDLGDKLIGARSTTDCSKQLAVVSPGHETKSWPVIDASAEAFSFYPEMMVITPLAVKKRWTKSEMVDLYNVRRNPDVPEYVAGSLNNKRFDRVVAEIVVLLNEH